MIPRRLHIDSDVLAELARDEDLLDAVIGGVERGALEVVTTLAQAEELEVARGDMACSALAGLERLPTTIAAPDTLASLDGPGVTVVTDEPVTPAPTDPPTRQVWTLDDLRRHLAGS